MPNGEHPISAARGLVADIDVKVGLTDHYIITGRQLKVFVNMSPFRNYLELVIWRGLLASRGGKMWVLGEFWNSYKRLQ
jgi:hypothetical protein